MTDHVAYKRPPWTARVAVVAIAIVGVAWWICWYNQVTTVVLVRHAEKGAGSNPLLTPDGTARAQELIEVTADDPVAAVYATKFCRTTLTAEPTAAARGLDIFIHDTGQPANHLDNCGLTQPTNALDASIVTSGDLIAHVVSSHRGRTVLVVGHSNTIPEMLEAVGVPSLCPDYFAFTGSNCWIPDDEFHHLFILRVHRWFVAPRLIKTRYGN